MSTPAQSLKDEPLVLVSNDTGTTTLTLNRPAQFNALTTELLTELENALAEIKRDPDVRVVVLSGNGKAFSVGCDLKQMRSNPDQAYQKALFDQCSRVTMALMGLPQVVVARVHGIAAAMGCQFVASCDLAVASSEASFGVCGINLGLFCASPGAVLSRNIARKRAFDLLFTGRFIDADAAEDWGLVNKVVPPAQLDEAVREYAQRAAAKLPVAVRTGKSMFYRQLDMGIGEALDLGAELMARDMMDPDVQEGIDAFIEKRPPAWKA